MARLPKEQGVMKYLLIFLIPVTASLGSYLLPLSFGGITLYGLRSLILLILLFLPIIKPRFGWWRIWVARWFVLVGGIWVYWGALSITWSPDPDAAIFEVIAILFGIIIALILLFLKAYNKSGLKALISGWIGAYTITLVVAVWEIATGNHLPSAFTEQAPDYAQVGVTASTFGNPNNYGAFLVMAFPFLWLARSLTTRKYARQFYIILLTTVPLVAALTASRLAIIGMLVEMIMLILVNIKNPRRIVYNLIFISMLISLMWLFVGKEDSRIHQKLTRMHTEIQNVGSIGVRINLAKNAIWMVYSTYLMGAGAGSFEVVQQQGNVPYYTNGIINPHNYWLEVLSQYGLIVFLLLLWWYCATFITAIKYSYTKYSYKIYSQTLVVTLIGYIFASIANSSFIEQPTNWVFLASIMIIGTYITKKRYEVKNENSASDNRTRS